MQNSDFGALFGQLRRLFATANGEKTEAAAQTPGDIRPSSPAPKGNPGKEIAADKKTDGTGGAAPFSPAEPFAVKAEAFFMEHDKISRRIDEQVKAAAGIPPKSTIVATKAAANAAKASATEAKRLQNAAAELLTAARPKNPDEKRSPDPAEKIAAIAQEPTAAETSISTPPPAAADHTSVPPAPGKKPPAASARPERTERVPTYFALPLFPPSFPESSAAQAPAEPKKQ